MLPQNAKSVHLNTCRDLSLKSGPLSLEEGYELMCDGIYPTPLHHRQLHDAVIHSFHVGKDLDAEIQIYNCEGTIADTLEINPSGFAAWELQQREVA